MTSYQRRLFFFLGVATFFEGFDMLALTQLLPEIRLSFGLAERHGGYLVGFINVGTVLAYLLVRKADHWGRKRLLTLTIAGYTAFSFLSGLSPNVFVFGACQLAARIFLIAEWSTSMVYAAEEFPAEKRGLVIGIIQGFSSLGSVACAGLVPVLISLDLPWSGWRNAYFAGTLPLLLLAFARRGLRETRRFEEQVGPTTQRPSLTRIFDTPYRDRVLKLSLIWALTYVCTQNAVTFWKEFAQAERGFTAGEVGRSITIAALAAMPLVFAAGKLLDAIGRRRGAVIIFVLTAVGTWASYSLEGRVGLTAALVLGVFGASAVLPVLNAYNTELFPTDLRGDAFAWSNNLLGRVGYVLAPVIVGRVAESSGWGPTVSATAVFPLLALALILLWLPETRHRELEQTAAL